MSAKTKTGLRLAQDIFTAAAPEAAKLLTEMMQSEEASVAQRMACAESVLSRAMGKAGATAVQEPEPVKVTFSQAAKEYAK